MSVVKNVQPLQSAGGWKKETLNACHRNLRHWNITIFFMQIDVEKYWTCLYQAPPAHLKIEAVSCHMAIGMTKTHCNSAAGFSNANAGSTGSFHGASLNRLLQIEWDPSPRWTVINWPRALLPAVSSRKTGMPKTGQNARSWIFGATKNLLQWIGAKSASKRLIWHTTALSRGNGFRTVLPEGLRILKLLQAEFSLNSELSRLPQQQSCDKIPKPPSTFVSACGLFAMSYRGLSHFTVCSWIQRRPHHSEHLIRRKRCHLPRCTE